MEILIGIQYLDRIIFEKNPDLFEMYLIVEIFSKALTKWLQLMEILIWNLVLLFLP